jgi:DNA-binding Lrp family transcriptional regulator
LNALHNKEQNNGLNNRIDKIFSYFKLLDQTNASVLKAIGELGARNITLIAKQTHLPVTTVRFRLEKMKKDGQVLVAANPDLPKLGLAKAFVVADAYLGRQDRLFETIRNTAYWTYLIRCYGKHDGFCSYFAFPATYMKELEKYMREAKRLQAFRNSRFFWCTNARVLSPDFSWYDFKDKKWKFDWQHWTCSVLAAPGELPEPIREPADYAITVDKKDLLIIKELQKDETIGFNKLAEIVGISPQSVGSRYHDHILKRKLIINYAVDVYPYPLEISDLYLFKIDFADQRCLGKFANACEGKPFVVSYSKIIGKNAILVNVYIIKTEFPNFMGFLNRLFVEGLITDFFYVTLDQSAYRRQTVSYEYFENGRWLYDHSERVERLQKILEAT